jgi:hypothetical protein
VIGKWEHATSPLAGASPVSGSQPSPLNGSQPLKVLARTVHFSQHINSVLSPVKRARCTWQQLVSTAHSAAPICFEYLSTMQDLPLSDSWGIRTKWVFSEVQSARERAGSVRERVHQSALAAAPNRRRCTWR